jgi:hypothetical protein
VPAYLSLKEMFMSPQLCFFASVAFSFVVWGIVASRYIWPKLRNLDRTEALRSILVLHSFRFFGLVFLIPGVVSPELPASFAHPTAYGDLIAAVLALVALFTLSSEAGSFAVWIFNIWGAVDLLNAFYQGNRAGLVPGQLGAAYVIPTLVVPILLITHGLAFRILLQRQQQPATLESRHFA